VTSLTAASLFASFRRPAASRGTIGVEIGRTWLRVARRGRGPHDWSLGGVSFGPEDLDGSAAATRRLRERVRASGLPRGDTVCALCSPAVSIFPLALPATRPERMDALVATHAEKHLSQPLGEMVLDYSVLPEAIRRPGEETTMALVFAAPRVTVEGLISALDASGLAVGKLLTPACVLARRATAEPGGRRLFVATGEDATSIAVVEGGHVLLERILAWGRDTLLRRLESELRLAPEHARTALERTTDNAPRAADTDSPSGALREVLAPAFRELTGEAAGCLAYCGSVFRHAPDGRVAIVGPLAGNAPLREAFERELGLAVDAETPAGEPTRFATAIACARWTPEPLT